MTGIVNNVAVIKIFQMLTSLTPNHKNLLPNLINFLLVKWVVSGDFYKAWQTSDTLLEQTYFYILTSKGSFNDYKYSYILHMEKIYLSYFPPVQTVKEVICSPLICIGFHCGLHAWCSGNPHSFFFVVSPITVKTSIFKRER